MPFMLPEPEPATPKMSCTYCNEPLKESDRHIWWRDDETLTIGGSGFGGPFRLHDGQKPFHRACYMVYEAEILAAVDGSPTPWKKKP